MAGSVQYQRQIDEDDEEVELTRTEIVFAQMHARGRHWPKAIGVVEIFVGTMLTMLGVAEVFIVPLWESKDGKHLIIMEKKTCYGAGMFAGLVMVITGSTALRSTMSRRDTTVFRFFNLTIISLLVYSCITILMIVGYSKGWTSSDKYAPGSSMNEVHVFVTILTVLGLLFAVTGFVQYFDVICCGEIPLWSQWAKCFCPWLYRQRQRRNSFETSLREEFNIRNDPI